MKFLIVIFIFAQNIGYGQNDIQFFMDDTSQKFMGSSNVNFYVSIKGVGDYKMNTGPFGQTNLLGYQPKLELSDTIDIYVGPRPMLDTDNYKPLSKKHHGDFHYDFNWTAEYDEIEYPKSIRFKQGIKLRSLSDVLQIEALAKELRDNDKSIISFYGCFCKDSVSQSIQAIYDRYEYIKKEILKIYNCDPNRIDFEAQDVDCKFLPSLDIAYELGKQGLTSRYSESYLIECYSTQNLRFQENKSQLNESGQNFLDPLVQFLFENPSLGIELRFWNSKNISKDLAQARFESICRYIENKGIDRGHFQFKTFQYPSLNYIDSLKKRKVYYPIENEVSMYVQDTSDMKPCGSNGFQKINFIKKNATIQETECDSLRHLVRFIESSPNQKFKITGVINKDQDEQLATQRAQLVKDKLVNLGIKSDQLQVLIQQEIYLSDDIEKKSERYPPWYEYEIGVYLEIDN